MKLNQVPLVVTGVGVSAPIPTDSRISPTQIGALCKISASATYSVQRTLDDPYGSYPGSTFAASALWVDTTAVPNTTATSVAATINEYATAIRLNVSASTGTVSIMAWQNDSTLGG